MEVPFSNFSSLFEVAFAINFAGQIFKKYLSQKEKKIEINELRVSIIEDEIGDKKVKEITIEEQRIVKLSNTLRKLKELERFIEKLSLKRILSFIILLNILFAWILLYLSGKDPTMESLFGLNIEVVCAILFTPFLIKSLFPIFWIWLQQKIQNKIMNLYRNS